MPVLQLDDRQFPLNVGTTRVGAGTEVDVALPGIDESGVLAVIEVRPEGRTAISRGAPAVPLRVNGVSLGAEPTPLLHGDKVEVGGQVLVFIEDDKAGATRYVAASEIAALSGGRGKSGRATKASGGRLISLLDGKEYLVPPNGLMIGRDASCQVVVPQTEVSRHHAEILAADAGYLIRDLSTNGVLVNGTRVEGTRLLARADVLRVGGEEFRFYADVPTPAAEPILPQPIVAAAAAPPKARLSHPAASAAPDAERRRGLPVWVWVLAAALIAAGAFFVMQARS